VQLSGAFVSWRDDETLTEEEAEEYERAEARDLDQRIDMWREARWFDD